MKYPAALAATLFLILSCSKEEQIPDLSFKRDDFFFIKMYVANDSFLNQGGYDPVTRTQVGPTIIHSQEGDRSTIKISSTGSKRIWDDDDISFYNGFSKTGISLLGEYTKHFSLTDIFYLSAGFTDFKIFEDKVSVKLNLVNENNTYGRYVEGSFSFNCYEYGDRSTIIPVSGSFRLKVIK